MGENMTTTIIDKKKTKSTGKLLIFGFFSLVIVSALVIYFFFIKPNEWLTQKTNKIEVGSNVQICELVNCTDEVLVAYHPKPTEPYSLGKLNITFIATKGEESKDITFTYTVVDTTAPVIERINSQIPIGEEVDLSNYIKVTDNSGENLISKVTYTAISTTNLGDSTVELSVKDSSGNDARYLFEYSVIDPTEIAPDLPGTKKVMQFISGLNRVTYVAETGNPYGVTAGQYVGEFRKEVTFEGEEVGGVVLIPKVVEKLLADRDGKAIFIPADISELNNSKSIELTFSDLTINGVLVPSSLLEVDTMGNSVSILIPYTSGQSYINQNAYINNEDLLDKGYINFMRSLDFSDKYKFNIVVKFQWDFGFQDEIQFGQKVFETNEIFGIVFNSPEDPLDYSLSKSDMMQVGDTIVFLRNID